MTRMNLTTRTNPIRTFMYRWILFGFFAGFLLSHTAQAEGPTSDSAAFSEAVAAFKSGKTEDAKRLFLALEAQHPGDPTLLLNLGLIATKERRPGAALGLWRKGLAQHPTHDELSNAVDWLKPKLPKTEIARKIDAWEEWRRALFVSVSPLLIVTMSAVFFFFGGWMLLRWWGSRKRALDEELAMPPAPVGGATITILSLFLLATSIGIFIDRLDIRGTIVDQTVEVRSAPDAAATPLFSAFEGMEVIVRDTRKVGEETWRRVTYPGGLTGWIRDRQVLTSVDASEHAFVTTTPGVK